MNRIAIKNNEYRMSRIQNYYLCLAVFKLDKENMDRILNKGEDE